MKTNKTSTYSRPPQKSRRLLLLAPSFAVLAFLAGPLLLALYYSFTDYNLASASGLAFVGLENYIDLLSRPGTYEKISITLTFVVLVLVSELTIGFAVALLLDRQFRGATVLRTIVLLPMMIPLVVAALIWKTMMAPIEGVLNYGLTLLGLPALVWLGSPSTALLSIVLIDIWAHIPFATLILLAGLQGLPREPYEAARIDGASQLQLLRYLTLPLMSPFIALVAIFRSIEAYKAFDIIFATTEGGPGAATTTLHIAAYKQGFTYGFMGTALTYVFILAMFITVTVLILMRVWQRASNLRGGV